MIHIKTYIFVLSCLVFFCAGLASTMAQTAIVAHRGYSGIAPENTLVAFQKAINCGTDYIELDVRKTLDDSLVVIHDKTLTRTSSDGSSEVIAELSYHQLSQKKVGYSEKFKRRYSEQKIPTLREVLVLAKGKTKVCIEIKELGIEKEVLNLVNDMNMHKDVVVFSFYFSVLSKIREIDGSLPIAYLAKNATYQTLDSALSIHANIIGVGYETRITKFLLNKAHADRIEVWKWTVNDKGDLKELMDLKIDGIITNYPQRARRLGKRKKN